jgi:exosome complex exonuclease RRP6
LLPYSFSHPYEFELERFTPPATQLEHAEPRMYNPLQETPLVMVEHADQLPSLLQDLASYSEIAVDMEVSRSLQ